MGAKGTGNWRIWELKELGTGGVWKYRSWEQKEVENRGVGNYIRVRNLEELGTIEEWRISRVGNYRRVGNQQSWEL